MISILLFDDNLCTVKYLEAVMKKHVNAIKVFTSNTYKDSIEIIHSQDIDIAFIDLKMPGKNGADFIYYLNNHEKFSGIKKVVITETGKNTLLKTSIEKEVDAYLHKEEIFNDHRKVIACLS